MGKEREKCNSTPKQGEKERLRFYFAPLVWRRICTSFKTQKLLPLLLFWNSIQLVSVGIYLSAAVQTPLEARPEAGVLSSSSSLPFTEPEKKEDFNQSDRDGGGFTPDSVPVDACLSFICHRSFNT